MFKHILVPLDSSFRAEQALTVAARIARASGASIHLLRVVQLLTDYEWQLVGSGEIPLDLDTVMSDADKEASTYLTRAQELAVLRGISVSTQVVEGDPARGILSVSHSTASDLIVMSSHGYTGIRHWLLGSVAEKVTHYSSVPVLVLHDSTIATLTKLESEPRPVRVLVALDGSPLAESSLEAAALLSIALSRPGAGELHLARIMPLVFTEGKFVVNNERAIAEAQRYLMSIEERLSKEYDETQLTTTSSVTLNVDIAGSLIELAETGEGVEQDEKGARSYDIIALATHGRGGIERWLMGSIAERVLSMTKLPLLIVRPARTPAWSEAAHKEQHKQSENMINELQPWVGLL